MFESLLLKLVHCLLTIGLFFRQWLFSLSSYWLPCKKAAALNTIRADAKQLKKLPIHIGILILEDHFSYVDIANVVLWSIAFGISYISVYDVDGLLKRNYKKLKEEIDLRRVDILKEDNYKYDIHMKSEIQEKSYANGIHSSKRVDIQILSHEDGRKDLVETVQELSQRVSSQGYRIEDICPQNIDNILQEKHKFPDPDLLVRFGQVESLLGFLPWQCRLTEMLSLPSHIGIQYKSYLTRLQLFGRIQQRFGT